MKAVWDKKRKKEKKKYYSNRVSVAGCAGGIGSVPVTWGWGRLLGAQLHLSSHPLHSVPCNIALPFIFLPHPLPIPSHPSLYHVPLSSFTLTFFLATPLRHCSTFPLSSSSDKNNQSYHKNQAPHGQQKEQKYKCTFLRVPTSLSWSYFCRPL